MTTLAAGAVVAGRFELLRSLGAGGLAEVWVARDRVTGSEVALKFLHAHLLHDEALKERFRRELSVTRGLDHPGIVRVFDLYQDEGGRPFFSMEYLRGQTLAERMAQGPMSADEARAVAREVAAALAAAHRAGVIHRDLKPQNIFLAEGPAGSPRVKLLDFGLARVAGWARLTAQSTVMGTPGYVAPELLSGTGADPRADLYSLGATFFEMLTGRRAFPSADPYEVLRRQKEPAPSARAVAPSVSDADDAVVRRALDPDPEGRFADASQMAKALAGETVPAAAHVPPPLTGGDFDVVVHTAQTWEARKRRKDLKALVAELGGTANRKWMWRLQTNFEAVLVAGASQQSAQAVALLCQERGIPATVRSSQATDSTGRAKAMRLAGLVVGASGLCISGGLLAHGQVNEAGVVGLAMTGPFVALMAALGVTRKVDAPIAGLPRGDPAVLRLADGIARRVRRLDERIAAAPEALKLVLTDLARAGQGIADVAKGLAAQAAALPDGLAGANPAEEKLSPLHAQARDALTARLLEMAAALDDALVVAASSAAGPASASQAIARLREEIAFAQAALPGVQAALRGELAAPDAPRADSPRDPSGPSAPAEPAADTRSPAYTGRERPSR